MSNNPILKEWFKTRGGRHYPDTTPLHFWNDVFKVHTKNNYVFTFKGNESAVIGSFLQLEMARGRLDPQPITEGYIQEVKESKQGHFKPFLRNARKVVYKELRSGIETLSSNWSDVSVIGIHSEHPVCFFSVGSMNSDLKHRITTTWYSTVTNMIGQRTSGLVPHGLPMMKPLVKPLDVLSKNEYRVTAKMCSFAAFDSVFKIGDASDSESDSGHESGEDQGDKDVMTKRQLASTALTLTVDMMNYAGLLSEERDLMYRYVGDPHRLYKKTSTSKLMFEPSEKLRTVLYEMFFDDPTTRKESFRRLPIDSLCEKYGLFKEWISCGGMSRKFEYCELGLPKYSEPIPVVRTPSEETRFYIPTLHPHGAYWSGCVLEDGVSKRVSHPRWVPENEIPHGVCFMCMPEQNIVDFEALGVTVSHMDMVLRDFHYKKLLPLGEQNILTCLSPLLTIGMTQLIQQRLGPSDNDVSFDITKHGCHMTPDSVKSLGYLLALLGRPFGADKGTYVTVFEGVPQCGKSLLCNLVQRFFGQALVSMVSGACGGDRFWASQMADSQDRTSVRPIAVCADANGQNSLVSPGAVGTFMEGITSNVWPMEFKGDARMYNNVGKIFFYVAYNPLESSEKDTLKTLYNANDSAAQERRAVRVSFAHAPKKADKSVADTLMHHKGSRAVIMLFAMFCEHQWESFLSHPRVSSGWNALAQELELKTKNASTADLRTWAEECVVDTGSLDTAKPLSEFIVTTQDVYKKNSARSWLCRHGNRVVPPTEDVKHTIEQVFPGRVIKRRCICSKCGSHYNCHKKKDLQSQFEKNVLEAHGPCCKMETNIICPVHVVIGLSLRAS